MSCFDTNNELQQKISSYLERRIVIFLGGCVSKNEVPFSSKLYVKASSITVQFKYF